MKYAFVPFHEVAEEIAKSIPTIFEEMNESYDQPNVDWDYYLESSYAGQCFAVTARNEKLIGVAVFFIGTNAHHKTIIEATNSLLYVAKPFRGRVSLEILNKSDEFLKAMGVHEASYLLKDNKIAKLLARRGYKPEYTSWSVKYE